MTQIDTARESYPEPQMLPVNTDFWTAYSQACSAMMQICYGRNWVFGEYAYATTTVEGVGYIINVIAHDSKGARMQPNDTSRFISFQTLPPNVELESRIITKYQEITSDLSDYCDPREKDFVVHKTTCHDPMCRGCDD